MPKLTHFDDNGNPNMVDVSQKEPTVRIAEASGHVYMEKATLNTILNKEISKGDVFQIAKISGIMASKNINNYSFMSPYNYRQSNIRNFT